MNSPIIPVIRRDAQNYFLSSQWQKVFLFPPCPSYWLERFPKTIPYICDSVRKVTFMRELVSTGQDFRTV